jgi:hypothetical protein
MRKAIALAAVSLIGFGGVAHAFNQPTRDINFDNNRGVFDYVPAGEPIAPWAKCPQWWPLMRRKGFSEADIKIADFIIHRESKCIPEAHNSDDPVRINGVKGSLGLFQINLFWISKTTAFPKGFLQTALNREITPKQLFDPELNIVAAKAIIDRDKSFGGCGWTAWAKRDC